MSAATSQSDPVEIPDKLYFKIGEVAKITGLKPYVLRYWETEFSQIRPTKSKANQRVYQRKDIETILLIKTLLYQEKFTISGARTRIKELRGRKGKAEQAAKTEAQAKAAREDQWKAEAAAVAARKKLRDVRGKLERMRDLLSQEIGA